MERLHGRVLLWPVDAATGKKRIRIEFTLGAADLPSIAEAGMLIPTPVLAWNVGEDDPYRDPAAYETIDFAADIRRPVPAVTDAERAVGVPDRVTAKTSSA